MNAIEEIKAVLKEACNKNVDLTIDTDLLNDKILDSLDSMVFFMLFEQRFSVKIPEDIDLKEEGYYAIKKLVSLIEK